MAVAARENRQMWHNSYAVITQRSLTHLDITDNMVNMITEIHTYMEAKMQTEQQDPFEKLFDASTVEDRNELLAKTVYPFARFTSRVDPEIVLTTEGEDLTVREKLLVYLLASKILHLKELRPQENASPTQIEKETGIPGGSIRPNLKALSEDNLVRNIEGQGYYVPDHRIKQVHSLLKEKILYETNN